MITEDAKMYQDILKKLTPEEKEFFEAHFENVFTVTPIVIDGSFPEEVAEHEKNVIDFKIDESTNADRSDFNKQMDKIGYTHANDIDVAWREFIRIKFPDDTELHQFYDVVLSNYPVYFQPTPDGQIGMPQPKYAKFRPIVVLGETNTNEDSETVTLDDLERAQNVAKINQIRENFIANSGYNPKSRTKLIKMREKHWKSISHKYDVKSQQTKG